MYRNLWRVLSKMYGGGGGATIVSQEIERGDIIVYETGIYKAVVVSARASKCFFFYTLKWKDCLDQ